MDDFENTQLEDIVFHLLKAVGENPEREGLRETPRRVAESYKELLWGMNQDAREVLGVTFEEDHHELVIVKDIPFFSLCEHHMLPFHGLAHVAYIPDGRVIGLSKLARAVEIFSRRLQLQERLTSQIADAIDDALHPTGVGVVVEAVHLCMTMRGVRKPGSQTVTSAMRGIFQKNSASRAELLSLLSKDR
ncbi:MAG TPA: GTP cyclohydrolase I FolE [Ktedonobacteraceae bacterium]|jgi:GTP cyclohydrolase I|nr:GTP cyclohydrolase I FolE [Ktedonobacteraceae bacterium]